MFCYLCSDRMCLYCLCQMGCDQGCDSEAEFRCKNSSVCLPRIYRCDGEKNCLDGSDEHGCCESFCVCVCVCLFFNFYYLPPTWPLSYILRVFVCAPVQTVNGLAGSGIWSTRQSFCRSQCTLTLGFVSVKANLMFFLTDKKLSLLWKSTHHFGKLPSPVTKGILGEWVGRWKGIELLLSGISGSLSFFVFCFVFPDITVMVDWA